MNVRPGMDAACITTPRKITDHRILRSNKPIAYRARTALRRASSERNLQLWRRCFNRRS